MADKNTSDTKQQKLSVVIITKNEEKNIRRCLVSVQDIADQIVVVDSFSTDNTHEICKEFKVKFVKHEFEGHIEQKNFAISQARYPHILSLDADEALSADLKKEVLEIKNNWACDGYYLKRLTNYCGKWIRHSGWYPDKKLRLFDSRKGSWKGVNPHDKYMMEKDCQLGHVKADLLHYSINSISEHLEVVNKFSGIAAKAKFEAGQRSSYYHILVHPLWKFFKSYFIKAGFLDGYYGFVICTISSHATFLRYVKLRELQKAKTNAN